MSARSKDEAWCWGVCPEGVRLHFSVPVVDVLILVTDVLLRRGAKEVAPLFTTINNLNAQGTVSEGVDSSVTYHIQILSQITAEMHQ